MCSQQFQRVRSHREFKTILKVLIVFFIAFIPRIFFIDRTSIMTDEPLYVYAGRNYFQSFLRFNFETDIWRINAEHPPIAKLLIGFASSVFIHLLGGENTHNLYFAARLAPVAAGTLTCVAIYLFGRRCYGEKAAFLASILTAVSPWLVYYSTLAILDIFVSFFITLTFIFLCYAEADRKYYIPVGIFLGLAVGSKGTAVAAIPGIILYLFIINIASLGAKRGILRVMKILLLLLAVAALAFFASWPWLWRNTLERIVWVLAYHGNHMIRGHSTFYAGKVYTHVPPWVPVYVLFVKTPLLLFFLSVIFILFMFFKIIKKESIKSGYISVFSWLIGGVLTMSVFPIIIGDHYLVFLGPAVLISASIAATDLIWNLKMKNLKSTFTPYILMFLMIMECLAGLAIYNSSPCGYANELVNRADKSVLIIDTGFEDAAEYLIKHVKRGAVIAVAYSPNLLKIELLRKNEADFKLVTMKELSSAEYAVFPSIYSQRWGIPENVMNEWELVHVARSGETVLCYVFKAPH